MTVRAATERSNVNYQCAGSRKSIVAALSALGVAGLCLMPASCSDAGPGQEALATTSSDVATLAAVTTFGSNPGSLLMYTYVPAAVPAKAPLVLALHGCTETAAEYEDVGWNAIADKYKFYLVYPQQQSANNPYSCFNWGGGSLSTNNGDLDDITRGKGEAESIAQMVSYMESTYSIDTKRVFVSGFSAGAAYTAALLALYPDIFAAGASFSGIPALCATNQSTAYTCEDSAVSNTPAQWATVVHNAYPGYSGSYPRMSIWQGSSDTTVNTANFGELVDQWTCRARLELRDSDQVRDRRRLSSQRICRTPRASCRWSRTPSPGCPTP